MAHIIPIQDKQPGTPVLGIHPIPKRILGIPTGADVKVRVRMRPNDKVKVFFRFNGDTCRFEVCWANHGLWQISAFTGVNATLVPSGQ